MPMCMSVRRVCHRRCCKEMWPQQTDGKTSNVHSHVEDNRYGKAHDAKKYRLWVGLRGGVNIDILGVVNRANPSLSCCSDGGLPSARPLGRSGWTATPQENPLRHAISNRSINQIPREHESDINQHGLTVWAHSASTQYEPIAHST
jgi:hypothetical protein